MVSFEAVSDDAPTTPSQDRLLDASEIEHLVATNQSTLRNSVQAHLLALAKKLRKEGEALQRVEKSRAAVAESDEKKEDATQASSPPTVIPVSPSPQPIAAAGSSHASNSIKYQSIDRFSFDAGGYNAPFVTVYAPLPRIGSLDKEQVQCNFTKSSFDLVVRDLEGKNYRLFKDNLEKGIDAEKSKIVVKTDKVVIKLAKIKSEYGSYDYWTKLVDEKKASKKDKPDDPSASIMSLMKDMYDNGDDKMKKMIGETMMKQRNGELGKDSLGGGMRGDDMDF